MTGRDPNKPDPVSAVHERAKEFDAHILEHSRDAEAGETVAGGYMARGNAKPEAPGKGDAKRRSDDLMNAVIDSTAAVEERLKRLREEQQALYDRLSDIEVKIDKLEQVARTIDAGDMPEIGDDGKLKDAELEAMIASEEKRLGRSIDRSDPQALMAIFAAEHQRSITERDETLKAIDRNAEKIEAIKESRYLGESPEQGLQAASGFEKANGATREVNQQIVAENRLDQFTF